MDRHFHIWLRRGRAFLIVDRPYTTRSHANKDAEKMAPAPEDRMVRGCAACPPSQPSKKKKKGNPKIAAELFAQPLGSLDQVRQAVDLVLGK